MTIPDCARAGFIVSGKLLVSQLDLREKASEAKAVEVPQDIMTTTRWTKEQLKLAFHLYCQLPFGRLHSRNPEIIQLAKLIGRTPGAVAMKLVNFASLDPAITSTGRAGLGNAGSLDKEVWAEFHADWEKLAVECELLRRNLDLTMLRHQKTRRTSCLCQKTIPAKQDESLPSNASNKTFSAAPY